MRLNRYLWSLIFLVVPMLCFKVSAQSINFNIALNGLTSLTYGSTQLVSSASNGIFRATSVTFYPSLSTTIGSLYSVDTANKIVTHKTTSRFEIQCRYVKVSDTRLDFKFVVKNTSPNTLTKVAGQFAILTSDSATQMLKTSCSGITCILNDAPVNTGGWNFNAENGPQINFFSMGTKCNIAACNISNQQKNYSWFGEPYGNSSSLKFTFALSQNVQPNSYSDTCTISLRFDAPGKLTYPKLSTLCADAVMLYGGEHPSIANDWPDRRPIGRSQNAAAFVDSTKTLNNPNNFCNNQQNFDVRTPAGLEQFRTRMLGWANNSVSVLRKMNAQGVIEWSIEGFGYLDGAFQPDPTATMPYPSSDFPGDPHMATTLAPELNYVGPNSKDSLVDEYFKVFIDNGFKTGVCIDPNKIVKVGNAWAVVEVDDIGQEIYDDVKYAHDRWGCQLFYVDANIHNVYRESHYPINGETLLLKSLAAFNDVLIIPEHQTYDYYRLSAVWDEVNSGCADGVNATPSAMRMVYPNTFSVIALYPNADGCGPLPVSPWISGNRKGDIYLAHCWYDYDGIDSIAKINTINGVRPYNVKITSPDTGSTVGKTFTITATASDSGTNSGVDSVEFLSSGIKVGVSKTASNGSYSFTWTDAIPGKHSLYARAIDKTKNQACSQPVNVVVDATAIRTIDGPMLKSTLKGPMSVSVYSLNGRLIRQLDSKDPTRLSTPIALRGLSSGIYIMKIKHANGAIDKRKMEVVW